MVGCNRVVLFPQPFVGHLTPMIHLGNILHSKGFSITIIHTNFNSPDPSKFPNFTFHFIADPLSEEPYDPASDTFKDLRRLNTSCFNPFNDCLSGIIEEASKDNDTVACLVLDPCWIFAAGVADSFKLPRIALRTGSLLALLLYHALPLLQLKGYFPLQESRLEDKVPEVPPLKVKDLTPETHHDAMAAMVEVLKHCRHGIICNTFEELESSILYKVRQIIPSIPIFPIGPLHKHTSNIDNNINVTTQDFLNLQPPNSVLYVSFGTVVSLSKEQVFELAWGLAKSEQPFLWVVRPKLTNDDLDINDLRTVAQNGHIVEWVPQTQVLAHPAVGGFFTHCGWNSTLESISEGVPMICFPFLGDQMANARQVSEFWRVGLVLEKGLQRDEVERTIRRLMVEKEGEEMRERVVALKEKAKDCIMDGGSTYESLDCLTNHILSFCYDKGM